MKGKKLPNYKMILLARESRGISQTELSNILGISQGNLSKIEQGIYPINDELLHKLADALNYPRKFFFEFIDRLPVNQQFHRKRKTIQKKYLTELDSNLTVRRLQIKKLLQSIEVPEKIPRLSINDYGSPEEIAMKLRAFWKIPTGPIQRLVELLENNGLIIIATDNFDKLDGMALPDEENIPIIYLNSDKPADRQRFTLAHELGHIVMHTDYIPKVDDDVEEEADRFASEFLIPSEGFKSLVLGRKIGLSDLSELKRYWKTSMASILYKLHQENLITPKRYRSLNVELSRSGYRKREPDMGVTIDSPSLLKELVEAHLSDLEYSRNELAELLLLNEEEFLTLFYKPKGTKLRRII